MTSARIKGLQDALKICQSRKKIYRNKINNEPGNQETNNELQFAIEALNYVTTEILDQIQKVK